jgi:hypothetical protein
LNITANNGGTDIEFSQIEARRVGENYSSISRFAGRSLLMEGQGLAGGDNIFIGAAVHDNVLTPYFNWRLVGFTAFEITDTLADQPGASPYTTTNSPKFVLDDGPMEYWLFGNGRYVICVCKIGTEFLNMMMGLMLPYSQPAEYSYPLVIAGTSGNNYHYTSTDIRLRSCFDPGQDACFMRSPGGTWLKFQDFTSSAVTDRSFWPYMTTSTTWHFTYFDEISEGLDGTYELWPIIPIEIDDLNTPDGRSPNLYGELQDVFYASGSNLSAEDTITIGPDTYLAFQNVFRVTFVDYYCIKVNP